METGKWTIANRNHRLQTSCGVDERNCNEYTLYKFSVVDKKLVRDVDKTWYTDEEGCPTYEEFREMATEAYGQLLADHTPNLQLKISQSLAIQTQNFLSPTIVTTKANVLGLTTARDTSDANTILVRLVKQSSDCTDTVKQVKKGVSCTTSVATVVTKR